MCVTYHQAKLEMQTKEAAFARELIRARTAESRVAGSISSTIDSIKAKWNRIYAGMPKFAHVSDLNGSPSNL